MPIRFMRFVVLKWLSSMEALSDDRALPPGHGWIWKSYLTTAGRASPKLRSAPEVPDGSNTNTALPED
jgi:hypothetical protein